MDLSKLTAAVAETEREFNRLVQENTGLRDRLSDIQAAVAGAPFARLEARDDVKPKAPVVSPRVAKGKRGRPSKISDADARDIASLRAKGLHVADIAKRYKATPPTIYAALKRASANGNGAGKH